MIEVFPGITIFAEIFANGPPLAFAQIRTPFPPRNRRCGCFSKPTAFLTHTPPRLAVACPVVSRVIGCGPLAEAFADEWLRCPVMGVARRGYASKSGLCQPPAGETTPSTSDGPQLFCSYS